MVAEGVETVEQLRWLQQVDCDSVQGFLFARPMPVDEASRYPVQIAMEKYQTS